MKNIDYDIVADFYDIYVNTDYDIEFFKSLIPGKRRILELTSGTGRLSIPLIEAGANLACVDQSPQMLKKLEMKLRRKNLQAEVLCMDLLNIQYNSAFDMAILPFQSFMEIIGKEDQIVALDRIHQALMQGGSFICTMHNPVVRRRSVDGALRFVGHFETEAGTLAVSGVETGGKPVVERYQYFELYDESGQLQSKRMLKMRFELINKNEFREMAESVGFKIQDLFGNYDRSGYAEETSPVMIWVLGKR